MNRKRRWKFAGIILIWIISLGYLFRYYPIYAGPFIPSGWGTNIDFARHSIVQNGDLSFQFNPLSNPAAFMGSNFYDWGSIYFAIVNIVTGTTKLPNSIGVLNLIPFFSLAILPLLAVSWMRRTAKIQLKPIYFILIILFSTTLTKRFLIRVQIGYHTGLIARAAFFMFIYLLAQNMEFRGRKASLQKASLLALLLIVVLLPNTYHTWTIFYILLVGTLVVMELIVSKLPLESHLRHFTLERYFGLTLITGMIFLLVGLWINDRFQEIALQIFGLVHSGQLNYFNAAGSDLIGTSVDSIFANPTADRILTLVSHIISAVIVLIFVGRRIMAKDVLRSALRNPYERVIILSLPMFIPLAVVLYVKGGIGLMLGRIVYLGIFWVLIIAAIEIGSAKLRVRKITGALVICLVLISLTAVPANTGAPQTTHSKIAQYSWTQHIDNTAPIYGDSGIAPSLSYYNSQNIIVPRVTQKDWQTRVRTIYFNGTALKARAAITATIEEASKRPDNPRYVVFSKHMYNDGISLYSFKTKPVSSDTMSKLGRVTNKIYTNGDERTYQYEKNN